MQNLPYIEIHQSINDRNDTWQMRWWSLRWWMIACVMVVSLIVMGALTMVGVGLMAIEMWRHGGLGEILATKIWRIEGGEHGCDGDDGGGCGFIRVRPTCSTTTTRLRSPESHTSHKAPLIFCNSWISISL